MLRIVLGIVAGCVLAVCVIFGMELISQQLFPPPPGVDLTDPQALKTIASQMPVAALAFVVLGWIVGTAVGGWAANWIARRSWPAFVVGGLIAVGSVANSFVIAQPLWMDIAGVVAPALTAWLVSRFASPAAPAAA